MQGFAKLEIQAYIVLGRSREFYHGLISSYYITT